MPENTVTATARAYFRGQEGEGEDGMVKPGDVLKLSRQRAADLKANGLVEVSKDAPTPDAEPASPAKPAAAPAAAITTPPAAAPAAKVATAPAEPAKK